MNQSEFAKPGPEFRSVPLWAQVDEMQPQEVARQIAEVARQGFGGVVIMASAGLETPPYLTSQWMDHVALCVQEAKARGIGVILYDEDLFTSGFARGRVGGLNPEHRVKVLVCREDRQYEPRKENLRVFLADKLNGEISNPEPLDCDAAPEPVPGKVFLHFYQWTQGVAYQSPRWRWHGWTHHDGFNQTDLLDPAAVRAFIGSTHEAYAARLGHEFGRTIRGIFTDEPDIAVWAHDIPFSLPWTPGFPAYFAGRTGYDVLDHLPSLFYDVGQFRRVRHDFWSAVSNLFVESYSKQIGDWCAEHGLAATGHYFVEEELHGTMYSGAMMRHYEHQQIPGIDHLGQNIEHYGIKVKQVDSVACQLGKERVLSETYACSSNNIDFQDRKWMADWEFALGVNLLNPSFVTYSLRGYRKRNWSPVMSWQQPWWPHNHLFEDYIARLSYALTQGERVTDILVIHPVASVWAELRPLGMWAVERFDVALSSLSTALLEAHRDYHFGDEQIMERHARVEGTTLLVGRASYRVVIVPPATTLSESTVQLLRQFAANGGRIIAIEPVPSLINARPARNVLPPSTAIIGADMTHLVPQLDEILQADVALDAPNILCQHRRADGKDIYFLANTDPREGWEGTVKLHTSGRLEQWNLHTGHVRPLPMHVDSDSLQTQLSFPPAGSRLLVVDRAAAPLPVAERLPEAVTGEVDLTDTWEVERLSENVLVLDYAKYQVADREWNDLSPVPVIYESLRRRWVGAPLRLRYEFELEDRPAGDIHLAVEMPQRHRILVNGQEVAYTDIGYWVDISFKRIDISAFVREGRNVIELETVFEHDTEIEPCYVVGGFAVRVQLPDPGTANAPDHDADQGCELPGYRDVSRFAAEASQLRITREENVVRNGDLVCQGYPFLAGTIALRQEVDVPSGLTGRVFLQLRGLHAILARVEVNGADAGVIAFRPHEIEITRQLKEGRNRIEVQLVSSLRNVVGPLHHQAGDLHFLLDIGDAFASRQNWSDAYQLVPLGFAGARILWRR